jgi:hypothetical protein
MPRVEDARAPFPFFLGCGRSGTTLIRTIFNEHPSLAIPRESHFIPRLALDRRRFESDNGVDADRLLAALRADPHYRRWRLPDRAATRALARASDLSDAIRRLYRTYARRQGKRRFGDKTPNYATQIPLLADLIPEARFIHVIRDGRNVALSIIERDFGPDRLEDALLYWRHQVTAARAAGARLGPARYLEYRHEDLIADPERTVSEICRFIDLEFAPVMLRYHEGRDPGSVWHRHLAKPPTPGLRDFRGALSGEDGRVVELLVGDLLEELRYEVEQPHAHGGQRHRARARARAARIRHRGARLLDLARMSEPVRVARRLRLRG